MGMTETATRGVYDIWAFIYDWSFGRLVAKRQRRAVEQLRPRPGERVLDLGVGTGMTLRHYPPGVRVVGMDLSGGMLTKAAHKIRDDRLTHCALVQGDAMLPPFAEHSFDHIIISHVISVVSDPQRLLAWARRLVRPGGRIVVLNHFQSNQPVMAWLEHVFNPVFNRVGWRSDLSLEECLVGNDLHVQYRFKLAAFDIWQIVVLSEQRPHPDTAAPRAPQGGASMRPVQATPANASA